jgi:hypothetical protein
MLRMQHTFTPSYSGKSWEMPMTSLVCLVLAQAAADGIEHTDRIMRARSELAVVKAEAHRSLAEAHTLAAEIDAMLANSGKALIEEYYRPAKKSP